MHSFRTTSTAVLVLFLAVRPGYKADVVIFDAQRMADQATYDTPHAYPMGIRWVLVNGQVILRDGERRPVLPGRVLHRAGGSPG